MLHKQIYELVAQGWFPVVCRESGDLIDYFNSESVAYQMIRDWEDQDLHNGTHKPNFYEVVTEIPRPYILIVPMQKHINKGKTKVDLFLTNDFAYDGFHDICDELRVDIEDNILSIMGDQTEFEAGGCGYDYRIELYLTPDQENESA